MKHPIAIVILFVLHGCYLSTPFEECTQSVGWVSYQGDDCPTVLRELTPVPPIVAMRAELETQRPNCDPLPTLDAVAPADGLRFEWRRSEPHEGDERTFDRYVALVVVDGPRGFDICQHRWGVLVYDAPCDITVPVEPDCRRTF